MKVLIVDDEEMIRGVLKEYVEFEGNEAYEAADGMEAVRLCRDNDYDVILMDVMMPKLDGFSAVKEIKKFKDIPVIMLSARGEEYDKLFGSEIGVDDYVTKPFKLLELLSRVRALLRCGGAPVYKHGGLVIDPVHMSVKKDGKAIYVTPTEFQILAALLRCNGQTVTRGTLLQGIWDDNDIFIDDNTLSVHVSRLREKIGAGHIVTVRGVGYRWED